VRLSKDALNMSVLVRRVWTGSAPFGWEVRRLDAVGPIYVSPERFRSMQEAYLAGQRRLGEFIPKQKTAAMVDEGSWGWSDIAPDTAQAA
jgi:hypothetical protein